MAATAIRPRDTGRLPLVGGLFQRLFIHHLLLVTVPIVVLGLLLVRVTEIKIDETLNLDGREIADQATNIAEDVIYMTRGEIVRHRAEQYGTGDPTDDA